MHINQLFKYEGGKSMTKMRALRIVMAAVLLLTVGTVFSGCCCKRVTALEEQMATALSKAEAASSAAEAAKAAAAKASTKADEAAAKADAASAAADRADAAAQSAAKSAQKAEAIFSKNMGK